MPQHRNTIKKWVQLPQLLIDKIQADITAGKFKSLDDGILAILRETPDLHVIFDLLKPYYADPTTRNLTTWTYKTTIFFPVQVASAIDTVRYTDAKKDAFFNEVIACAIVRYYPTSIVVSAPAK